MPKTNDLQKKLDDLTLSIFEGGNAVRRQYADTRKSIVGQLEQLVGQRAELDRLINQFRDMLDKLDARVAAVEGVLGRKTRATTQQKYNAAEVIYSYLTRRSGERLAAKDLADQAHRRRR